DQIAPDAIERAVTDPAYGILLAGAVALTDHEVVRAGHDQVEQARDVGRIVLPVTVDEDDDLSRRRTDAGLHTGALPQRVRATNDARAGRFGAHCGVVVGVIVYDEHLRVRTV